jgi:CheY-like chemotaxis protein
VRGGLQTLRDLPRMVNATADKDPFRILLLDRHLPGLDVEEIARRVKADAALRDVRLITIWTGTNEIMDLVIQHEFYREFLAEKPSGRDVESDARGMEYPEEKEYNE